MEKQRRLQPEEVDRVIEMAWEDRTPFEAILAQFGLTESDTIALMRREMHPKNFRKWRARVQGRVTKHRDLHPDGYGARFKCTRQRTISHNRVT